jgi:hypothetical protein
MKTLSHTSITLYLDCPQGYKLHYLGARCTRRSSFSTRDG